MLHLLLKNHRSIKKASGYLFQPSLERSFGLPPRAEKVHLFGSLGQILIQVFLVESADNHAVTQQRLLFSVGVALEMLGVSFVEGSQDVRVQDGSVRGGLPDNLDAGDRMNFPAGGAPVFRASRVGVFG